MGGCRLTVHFRTDIFSFLFKDKGSQYPHDWTTSTLNIFQQTGRECTINWVTGVK